MNDLSLDCCLTVSLCLCLAVSLQRVWGRGLHRDGGSWHAITFRCPGAEIGHLTSLRAEGSPRIAIPDAGFVTEGTGHAAIVARRIRESFAVNSGGSGARWRLVAIGGGGADRSPRGRGIRLRTRHLDSNGPRRTRS